MPPRVPSNPDIQLRHGDRNGSATSSNAVSSSKAMPPEDIPEPIRNGVLDNTFHWELNVYSFGLLALIYSLLPPTQRMWMHIGVALVALDAAKYYYRKGHMAGVPYTLPFVSVIAMVVHPVRFWSEMAHIAMANDGICTNTLVGNFMVFTTDVQLCRSIMTGEDGYGIYAHPNAQWLFGAKNLIYLEKETHKRFRAILTPALFSAPALDMYATAQERICREYLQTYAMQCDRTGQPMDARVAFRQMAAASSQEAFLGPYLTDALRQQLEQDILTFTMGFLCFPFPYLNLGLHRAIQAKDRIEAIIHELVPQARQYVQAGNAPRCLLENWSAAIQQAAAEQGVDPQQVHCCHDDDVARTVLDFLFAAQDATNSALTYSLDVLEAHPDVMHKMREEVWAVCGHDGSVQEKCREHAHNGLTYTAKVANQLLHHKPPVPMIPHLTKKTVTLGGHVLPKGTVAIPSITYSARTSGASLEFLPERDDQDALFVKCVVFGGGQHKCPGRRYAESLLVVFLACLAQGYEFARTGPRPTTDEFVYYPTVFPKDCNFMLSAMQAKAVS